MKNVQVFKIILNYLKKYREEALNYLKNFREKYADLLEEYSYKIYVGYFVSLPLTS